MISKNSEYQVDILLSVYNGSAYLKAQIESIVNQSSPHWRILARDDGSTDNSVSILSYYQNKYPEKFKMLVGSNLGVTQSFHELLKESDAPYVMFCDQDDLWFEDKIEIMMARIKREEKQYGTETPLLVFSDLALVDQNGAPIGPSFWRSHGIDPRHFSLNRLLLQNVVTGCASLINRPLVKVSLPIPEEAILHDWWFALNACLFGKLAIIDRTTVYYRQHSANQVGANGITFGRIRKLITGPESIRGRLLGIFKRTSGQAQALIDIHRHRIRQNQKFLLERYTSILDMTSMERKLFFLKEKIFFTSAMRNFCLFYYKVP